MMFLRALPVALAIRLAGFALVAAAMGLVGWTLLENPFASSAVRMQEDRGAAGA